MEIFEKIYKEIISTSLPSRMDTMLERISKFEVNSTKLSKLKYKEEKRVKSKQKHLGYKTLPNGLIYP